MKIVTIYSVKNQIYNPTFKSSKIAVTKGTMPAAISLLTAGCVTITAGLERVKKVMEEREKFIDLRENLAEKLEPLKLEAGRLDWDFYINSSKENMEKVQEAWDKYQSIFADKEVFENFKEINSKLLPKHEAKLRFLPEQRLH